MDNETESASSIPY